MRLVVDTNLMIRALRSDGPARRFFKVAPLTHTIIFHPEQVAELRAVAARARLAIETEAVDELAERISRYGEAVVSELDLPGDWILGAAFASTGFFNSYGSIPCRNGPPNGIVVE